MPFRCYLYGWALLAHTRRVSLEALSAAASFKASSAILMTVRITNSNAFKSSSVFFSSDCDDLGTPHARLRQGTRLVVSSLSRRHHKSPTPSKPWAGRQRYSGRRAAHRRHRPIKDGVSPLDYLRYSPAFHPQSYNGKTGFARASYRHPQ